MIEKLTLIDWKSFENSEVYIEPLTFLIGVNASGKSNVIDAFGFLQQLALGVPIDDIANGIRGGKDWVVRDGKDCFTLSVDVRDDSCGVDYIYTVTIGIRTVGFEVFDESLGKKESIDGEEKMIVLYNTYSPKLDTLLKAVSLYTAKQGRRRRLDLYPSRSILSQLEGRDLADEVVNGVRFVADKLRNIFILDPMPQHMRDYSPLSSALKPDASNIAGVLAGMSGTDRKPLLDAISNYVRPLPERDIESVWAETVGRFGRDAMLYCEENWTDKKKLVLDARGMSDGTLRFIAIVMVLLIRPKGSLILVEEVDNGLHPSRAKELVRALKEIGMERGVDILCTTHNPVLIDQLGTDLIPSIAYLTRDRATGSTKINTFDEREDFVRLVASGSIGDHMAKGDL